MTISQKQECKRSLAAEVPRVQGRELQMVWNDIQYTRYSPHLRCGVYLVRYCDTLASSECFATVYSVSSQCRVLRMLYRSQPNVIGHPGSPSG